MFKVLPFLAGRLTADEFFAAHYTDFREFGEKSVQISEIRGKGFGFLGMAATWVIYHGEQGNV
jgi:hypothetical protein